MTVWKGFIAAAGAALLLSACGGSGGGGGGTGDTGCTPKGAATATGDQTVKVVSDPNTIGAFDPKTITVKSGQSVTWDFQDSGNQHSVSSDDNSTFDSCLQNQGYKFTVTFTKAGSFPYHCQIHSGMVGTVTVTS